MQLCWQWSYNKSFYSHFQLQDANIAESSTDKPEPKKEAAKEAAEEDEREKDSEGTSVYAVAGDTEDIYKVPPSNEPLPKPDGVIYQVRTLYFSRYGELGRFWGLGQKTMYCCS